MSKKETFSSKLIALRNRLEVITQKSNKGTLEIQLADIDCFIEMSKVNKTIIEQNLITLKLATDNSKFDFYVKRIISDLDICDSFWNVQAIELKKFDYLILLNRKLSSDQGKVDLLYQELKTVSQKKIEIVNQLEAMCFKHDENDMRVIQLREEENFINKLYSEKKKTHFESLKRLEKKKKSAFIKYSKFNLETVFIKLCEIKEIIIPLVPESNLKPVKEGVLGMEFCGLFRRFSDDLLEVPLDDLTSFNLLNQRKIERKIFKFKRGGIEKFLFLLRCASNNYPLSTAEKNNWEKHVLNVFGQKDKSTYWKKGNDLAKNYSEFRNDVELAFKISSS